MLDHLGSPLYVEVGGEPGLVELRCRSERDLQVVLRRCADCTAAATGPTPNDHKEVCCSSFLNVGDNSVIPAFDVSEARHHRMRPNKVMSCWDLLSNNAKKVLLETYLGATI